MYEESLVAARTVLPAAHSDVLRQYGDRDHLIMAATASWLDVSYLGSFLMGNPNQDSQSAFCCTATEALVPQC